jgi:hypothetical protein
MSPLWMVVMVLLVASSLGLDRWLTSYEQKSGDPV